MSATHTHLLPIMYGSTGVFAVLDIDHKNRESQKPRAHGEAQAVHCLVTHKDLTVDVNLHARDSGASPTFTKAWNLQSHFQFMQHQPAKNR